MPSEQQAPSSTARGRDRRPRGEARRADARSCEAAQKEWEKQLPAEGDNEWNAVEADKWIAVGGDDARRAGGPRHPGDRHEPREGDVHVTFKTDCKAITGLRLETLPDPSSRQAGRARRQRQLRADEVRVVGRSAAQQRSASARQGRPSIRRRISRLRHGDRRRPETGWAIWAHTGKAAARPSFKCTSRSSRGTDDALIALHWIQSSFAKHRSASSASPSRDDKPSRADKGGCRPTSSRSSPSPPAAKRTAQKNASPKYYRSIAPAVDCSDVQIVGLEKQKKDISTRPCRDAGVDGRSAAHDAHPAARQLARRPARRMQPGDAGVSCRLRSVKAADAQAEPARPGEVARVAATTR